jgi:hypothetical protein
LTSYVFISSLVKVAALATDFYQVQYRLQNQRILRAYCDQLIENVKAASGFLSLESGSWQSA